MATRTAASLFALSWFVFPGFGLIDLSVTWSADWPQALEAGWGLFSTVIVGTAFVLVALQPRRAPAVVALLAFATVALVLSAVAGEEMRLAVFGSALALQAAILTGLAVNVRGPDSPTWADRSPAPRPLLVLAAVGAGPWLVYALDMWALNRRGQPIDVTLGVDHYAMQGALALTLAFLPALIVLRRDLPALVPACAGIAAFYLGLISVAWPDSEAGVSLIWSALAMCWGVAVLAATFAPRASVLPPRSA